jgi:hypothetical protein
VRAPLHAVLACALLASCADTGTAPQAPSPPASVRIVSRNPQPGAAGQRLPDSVVVRVVDGEGRGVPGADVQFSVSTGGGRMIPLVKTTDAVGCARAAWVLGGAAGEQSASLRPRKENRPRRAATMLPAG